MISAKEAAAMLTMTKTSKEAILSDIEKKILSDGKTNHDYAFPEGTSIDVKKDIIDILFTLGYRVDGNDRRTYKEALENIEMEKSDLKMLSDQVLDESDARYLVLKQSRVDGIKAITSRLKKYEESISLYKGSDDDAIVFKNLNELAFIYISFKNA